MDDVALICCGALQAEVTELLDRREIEATPYFVDTGQYAASETLTRALNRMLAVASRHHGRIAVVFGQCIPNIDLLVEEYGAVRVAARHCVEMLLGKESFSLLAGRAFFLLPSRPDKWCQYFASHLGPPDADTHDADSKPPGKFFFLDTVTGERRNVRSVATAVPADTDPQRPRVKLDSLLLALDKAIVQTLVKQLEVENVRLKSRVVDLRRSNADLAMIDAVNRELSTTLDLEAVARRLVNMVVELTGGAQASLLVADAYGEQLRCVGISNNVKLPLADGAFTDGEPARFIIDRCEPLVVQDVASPDAADALPDHIHHAFVDQGVSSYLGVPFLAGERCVAVLQAFDLPFPDHAEEYARTLSGVAPVATMALQNAMLFRWVAQERDKFSAIFSKVSDGIRVVDSALRIVEFNHASEQLTGWYTMEAIGRHCCEVYGVNGAVCSGDGRCPIQAVLRSGDPVPYAESSIQSRNGARVDIVSSFAPFAGPSGQREFAVAVDRNMSQVKELERLKSDFVARASHELRTPLASIKGYAETLLRRDVPIRLRTRQEFLKGIVLSADRLGQMADDLAHVSRIDAAELQLTVTAVGLAPLLQKVVNRFQLNSAHHVLQVDAPASLPSVLADPERLEDVLVNLVSNAIKYSPYGGEVAVHAHLDHDPDSDCPFVVVSVTDQGIGIAPEEITKVFQRFYRVRSPHTTRAPGIGLGLSICRTYIESMGGTIWVESIPEKGSTFSFRLPSVDTGGD